MRKTVKVRASKDASVVDIHTSDGGWNGHYRFVATGMSQQEVAAKQAAMDSHHLAKAARLTGFRSFPQFVNGAELRVSIIEQGQSDVRMVLRLFPASGERISLDRVYATVADIPTDAQIMSMVTDALAERTAATAAVNSHVASMGVALGMVDIAVDDGLFGTPADVLSVKLP